MGISSSVSASKGRLDQLLILQSSGEKSRPNRPPFHDYPSAERSNYQMKLGHKLEINVTALKFFQLILEFQSRRLSALRGKLAPGFVHDGHDNRSCPLDGALF
jgi:hypothetical protein